MSWQVDLFILALLTSELTVGLFSGPYRIFAAFMLIAQVVALPLFPLMSRMAANKDYSQLEKLYGSTLKLLLFAGTALSIYGYANADLVARILGDSYADAIPAIQGLSLAFPALFASSVFSFIYTATSAQSRFLAVSLVALVIRATTAYLLIPTTGYMGACIGIFVSEYIAVGCWIALLRRKGLKFHLIQGAGMQLICLLVLIPGLAFVTGDSASLWLRTGAGLVTGIILCALFAVSIALCPYERSLVRENHTVQSASQQAPSALADLVRAV